MEKIILTTRRIVIWFVTVALEVIFGLFFQNKLKDMSEFISNYFLQSLVIIILITCLVFLLYFLIDYIRNIFFTIKYMRVKLKYYDIMLTKFHDKNPNSSFNVFPDDTKLFTKEELKTLNIYMKNLEQLKIQMKGRNKTGGMFL